MYAVGWGRCLYEIFTAVMHNVSLDVIMPDSEWDSFKMALLEVRWDAGPMCTGGADTMCVRISSPLPQRLPRLTWKRLKPRLQQMRRPSRTR